MIKIGTLCILLAPHECAGQVCTVVSPLEWDCLWQHDTEVGMGYSYEIDIPGTAHPAGAGWIWCARPQEIRPLNDPDSGPRADVPRELVAA